MSVRGRGRGPERQEWDAFAAVRDLEVIRRSWPDADVSSDPRRSNPSECSSRNQLLEPEALQVVTTKDYRAATSHKHGLESSAAARIPNLVESKAIACIFADAKLARYNGGRCWRVEPLLLKL